MIGQKKSGVKVYLMIRVIGQYARNHQHGDRRCNEAL